MPVVMPVWGGAEELPGSATLNTGGNAAVTSVSCVSAGNCSVGGYYVGGGSGEQALVADEVNGAWGNPTELPGISALNAGGIAQITSMSCGFVDYCSAGGWYTDSVGNTQALIVSKVNGVWGKAQEVPGSATLNSGGDAKVTTVSCASASSCGAGGYYTDNSLNTQAFVVIKH